MSIRTIVVFIYFAVFTLPNLAFANCTFKTAEFINELRSPKSINSIKIKIPKSGKYNKNFFKIITSKEENIPPKLKKKFKAIIKVEYKFGTCTYNSSLKQNGDYKDHINFATGLRSLNIKLKDGNIQNAVKFKLLLPKTRGHYNEILGTIIAKELGFIVPETFEVLVNVNGKQSIMLFQEDAKKEMLERNNRREGPMFEGDESLLWSFENKKNFELEDISLARLTNSKWFSLGESSESITLFAYKKLQQAYLDYANSHPPNYLAIFPNQNRSTIFQDFHFLMTAMNGSHALRPHNRKYYYNSFLNFFEPIYYDGDLNINKELVLLSVSDKYAFEEKYKFPYKKLIQSENFSKNILRSLQNRVINYSEHVQLFAVEGLKQLTTNTTFLQNQISNHKLEKITLIQSQALNQYQSRVENHAIAQKKIHLMTKHKDYYSAFDASQKAYKLTTKQLGNLMSKNTLNDERYIFLPKTLPSKIYKEGVKTQLLNVETGGMLVLSSGISLDINTNNKKITINQTNPDDWILFVDTDLTEWTINFSGIKKNIYKNITQRFNFHGMTGCLNFYKSKFNKTVISGNDGQCEDTINIVSSSGSITSINVENSFSDAVDFDFSKLDIMETYIVNAGNDCLDVSGGTYKIIKAHLENCSDKGISVGEISEFNGGKIYVSQANIAIASKDLSKVIIAELETKDVLVCIEASQKKQEFGGAIAIIDKNFCEGDNKEDVHSKIYKGAL
tara:strand:+ start:866 stop:3058 length:2193 start_codon:yes stop_codon:yes gene_type:complete